MPKLYNLIFKIGSQCMDNVQEVSNMLENHDIRALVDSRSRLKY